jgi:transcriptional regulator with XRE-family HTH domain
MSVISNNIRFLRKSRNWTQEQFAAEIDIKRSLVGSYEEGSADPRLSNLLSMEKLFNVTVDDLISRDLTNLTPEQLQDKSRHELKVLPITVDRDDREFIELINQKASAGYTNGYSDPEFIEQLPRFRLPVLPDGLTYRAFEISGESMLPLTPGTVVIGSYVESIKEIKSGKTYILVTKTEGVVYKRVFNYLDSEGKLLLVSDNKSFSPYNIKGEDLLEAWEARAFVSTKFPDPDEKPVMTIEKLTELVLELQQEVLKIKS